MKSIFYQVFLYSIDNSLFFITFAEITYHNIYGTEIE